MALSQQKLADLCHITRRAVGGYEKGANIPGGEVLAAFAAAGADVSYILTGMRTAASAPELNHEEAALLDNYRNSPPEGKQALEAMCTALTQPKRIRAGAKR